MSVTSVNEETGIRERIQMFKKRFDIGKFKEKYRKTSKFQL